MAKAESKSPTKADTHIYPDTEIEVRILSLRDEGNMRATVSANLNGVFAIRNIKVLDGKNGLFVSLPSYKVGDEYKDIAFPVTKEFRQKFNGAVLDAYRQKLEQVAKQTENAPTSVPAQAPTMSQSM